MILLGPERTSAIVETLRAQFGAALSPRVEAMVRGCETGAPPALSGSRGVRYHQGNRWIRPSERFPRSSTGHGRSPV